MKITDKQRIDFVQRQGIEVKPIKMPHENDPLFLVKYRWPIPTSKDCEVQAAATWRQAVDKAIKAYMGGKK